MASSKPPSQSVQVVKAKYASSLNSEPTDRALLIGIQYSQSNFHHPLTQSHNDVALMKDALISLYHYDENKIQVLVDDGNSNRPPPTKANILDAMAHLMQDVQAGDRLFFHFSGHGLQAPCSEDDLTEVDGKDELIIPLDATDDATTWIRDNQLNEIMVKRLPIGASLVAVFDMCHAGTPLDLTYHEDEWYTPLINTFRRTSNNLRKFSKTFSPTTSRQNSASVLASSEPVHKERKLSSNDGTSIICYERVSAKTVKKHSVDLSSTSPPPSGNRNVDGMSLPRKMSLSNVDRSLNLTFQPGPPTLTPISITASSDIGLVAIRHTSSPNSGPKHQDSGSSTFGLRVDQLHVPPLSPVPESPATASLTLYDQSLNPAASVSETMGTHGKHRACCIDLNLRWAHFWRPDIGVPGVLNKENGDILEESGANRDTSFLRYFKSKQARQASQVSNASTRPLDPQNLSSTVPSASGMQDCIGLNMLSDVPFRVQSPSCDSFSSLGSPARCLSPIPLRQPLLGFAKCVPSDTSEHQLSIGSISYPPGPSSSTRNDLVPEDPDTPLAYSIGAADDDQLAYEYRMSVTEVLVKTLRKNPHPTYKELMTELSRYLHQASEEMHKFFEQQKADEDAGRVNCNASSTPKRQTTEFHKMKKIIEETREHVLRDRPFQRPVLGTLSQTDYNSQIFMARPKASCQSKL